MTIKNHFGNTNPYIIGMLAALVGGSCGVSEGARADTGFCKSDYCASAPPCADVGSGQDFSGQHLVNVNFADHPAGYLIGASFKGAHLTGVDFGGQDLSLADFTDAVFQANSDGILTDLSASQLTGTCFFSAELSGADFQYATFDGTDFTCADALDAKFGPMIDIAASTTRRTRFDYAQLGIARSASSYLFPLNNMSTTPAFWANTAFTCTRFVGLDPQHLQTAGADMSDAILRGIPLDGFSFYDQANQKGATLDRADLSYSSLRGADLTSASLDGSTMVGTDLSGATMRGAILYKTTGSDLTLARLNNAHLNEAVFDHATLTGAQIHDTQATGASFDEATFQASTQYGVASVIGSSFHKATFANAALNDVTFSRSDLSGAQLDQLTLSGTSFSNSILVDTNLESSVLQDVDFTGASLNNANFTSATLGAQSSGPGVNLTCTQLGGATFASATVSKANFQAAVIPPTSECCTQLGKNDYYCGDAVDGAVYGQTTLPSLPADAAVTCPNGQTGQCVGSDWQIAGWKTSLCDSSGQEQVVWSRPSCGKQPATVDIPDPNLKACIQEALFGGAARPITRKAAASLKFLSCGNRGVADVTGLDKGNFPALVSLDLSANRLSGKGDFSQFSDQLETVKLSYNRLGSLVFSNTQTSLNYLDASNNQLTSVSISPNAYLSHIDLSHNQLAGTLDFFATYGNNVEYLDLSYNRLTGVGSADTLTRATAIYLNANRLTTIGPVTELWQSGSGSLWYLQLDNNACFRCSTLGVPQTYFDQFGCSCDQQLCGSCD